MYVKMQNNDKNLALVDRSEVDSFSLRVTEKWKEIIGAGTALASTIASAFNPLLGVAVAASGALLTTYSPVGNSLEENWGYWMPLYDKFITAIAEKVSSREDIIKFCLKYSAFIKTEADVDKGHMVTTLNEDLIKSTLPNTLEIFQNALDKFPLLLNPANLAGGLLWKKYYSGNKNTTASKDDLLLVEAIRFFTHLTKTDFPITRLPITLKWPLVEYCEAGIEKYSVDKVWWNFPYNVLQKYKNRKGKYAKKTLYEWQKNKKIWKDLDLYTFMEKAYYNPWVNCSAKLKPCGGTTGAHMLVDNLNNFKEEYNLTNNDSQTIHNKVNLIFTNYFRETLDFDTFFDYLIWDYEVIYGRKHDWMEHHKDYWESCESESFPASAIIPVGYYPLFMDPYDKGTGIINKNSGLVVYRQRGGYLKLTGNIVTDKKQIWLPLKEKVSYILDIYKTMDNTIYNPQVGKETTIADERKANERASITELITNLSTIDKKNYLIYGGIALALFAAYRIMR